MAKRLPALLWILWLGLAILMPGHAQIPTEAVYKGKIATALRIGLQADSPEPPKTPRQGNAHLRFEEARIYKVPIAADIVTAADLDGDRCPDVVIGGGKELGVLYGHRDGTLAPY